MATMNKKAMSMGILLAVSFFAVLLLIFSPIFGDGRNGLQFSDEMFNKLSKGSSYFIPAVTENNEKFIGKSFEVSIKLPKPEQTGNAVRVLTTAGVEAEEVNSEIKISGDLGNMLLNALKDSDDMYKNDGMAVSGRYGIDEKEVMVAWWSVLTEIDKQFKRQGLIEEAKIVTEVNKKAIETAHNFYGIEAQRVLDKAGIMTGLLVFYVLYTMWWGFAIFYLFEGVGLTMKKAKIKKEV